MLKQANTAQIAETLVPLEAEISFKSSAANYFFLNRE